MVDADHSIQIPPVPSCVVEAASRAEHLYEIVSATEFPELPEAFESVSEAVQVADAAIGWGDELGSAHSEVVELFPRREDGVIVDLPPQLLPQNLGLSRLGFPRFGGSPQVPPATIEGEVTYRRFDLRFASDVLEPVPPRFENSMVTTFPMDLNYFVDRNRRCEFLAEALESSWKELNPEAIAQWRVVVRAKCLGLVAWVRQCLKDMKSATLPKIVWHSHKKNHGHTIIVSMAGADRPVDLTGSEHRLLSGLAVGPEEGYRTVKGSLVDKIPELGSFVTSLGAGSSISSSVYDVPPALRDLIDVAPRS